MPTLRITNLTRNSVLATHSAIASTPESKIAGLIGVSEKEFTPGNALFFPECNAIHTVQMSFSIGVLFIDMLKRRVVKVVPDAQPGCHFNTLIPLEICAVLELPRGIIRATGTQPGDVIALMSSAHSSQHELNRIAAL